MSDKIDLVYDIVVRLDEHQRKKNESDAARHAKEESWREQVDNKLENHAGMHKETMARVLLLEQPRQYSSWLKSKAAKVAGIVGSLITIVLGILKVL